MDKIYEILGGLQDELPKLFGEIQKSQQLIVDQFWNIKRTGLTRVVENKERRRKEERPDGTREAVKQKEHYNFLALTTEKPNRGKIAPRVYWYRESNQSRPPVNADAKTKTRYYASRIKFKMRTKYGFNIDALRRKAMPFEKAVVPVVEERLMASRKTARKLVELRMKAREVLKAIQEEDQAEEVYQKELEVIFEQLSKKLDLSDYEIDLMRGLVDWPEVTTYTRRIEQQDENYVSQHEKQQAEQRDEGGTDDDDTYTTYYAD